MVLFLIEHCVSFLLMYLTYILLVDLSGESVSSIGIPNSFQREFPIYDITQGLIGKSRFGGIYKN